MKQRFSSLDISVLASELNAQLSSLRLSQASDLSSRLLLLRFATPGRKAHFIIEPGFRAHVTQFVRASSSGGQPSVFVQKLRKYLKGRRVLGVRQLGRDRVLEVQFSGAKGKRVSLILEFYAAGNVILCEEPEDGPKDELRVLLAWRTVQAGEEGGGGEEVRVGGVYDLANRQGYISQRDGAKSDVTVEELRSALNAALDKVGKKGDKKPLGGLAMLRKTLATSFTEFPPVLLDHALFLDKFPAVTEFKEIVKSDELSERLVGVLKLARGTIDEMHSSESVTGWIIAKTVAKKEHDGGRKSDTVGRVVDEMDRKDHDTEEDKENADLQYEDFHPFLPAHLAAKAISIDGRAPPENESGEGMRDLIFLKFTSYNTTVDTFFSSLESQLLTSRLNSRSETARARLEHVHSEHAKRLGGLQQVQEMNVRKAQSIECNLHRVEECIGAVNGLIAQGMDWIEIERLIEMETKRGNPVAARIKTPLKLAENTITLLLDEESFENDNDEDDIDESASESEDESDDEVSSKKTPAKPEKDTRLLIDIDLALTPYANARGYYDQKKVAATKSIKTIESSKKAIASSEKKILTDLKKSLESEKADLRPLRQPMWFEKFFYFVSSDGYLVVSGRDGMQSDLIYKKYVEKGDVYVSADIDNAGAVWIKQLPGLERDSPIPPSTLAQAGTFALVTSAAWENKALVGAWHVNANKVSKVDDRTGDFLDPGRFVVKGEKNHMQPSALVLGFGVLFRVKDADAETREGTEQQQIVEDGDDDGDEPDDDDHAAPKCNPLQPGGSAQVENEKQDDGHEEDEDEEPAEDRDEEAHDEHSDEGDGETLVDQEKSVNGDEDESTDVEEASTQPKIVERIIPSSTTGSAQPPRQRQAPQMMPDKVGDLLSTPRPAQSAPSRSLPIRGKKSKQAKMKSKYADQDDEDRALALELLGSKGPSASAQLPSSSAQATNTTQRSNEIHMREEAERRRARHQKRQDEGKAAETEHRARLASGTTAMTPQETSEITTLLSSFTGSPHHSAPLSECIAICAPWDAVGSKLRWKIKIQPGQIKTGKFIREVLHSWTASVDERAKKRMPKKDDEEYEDERSARREGELVRLLKDTEVVGLVPVRGCRVVPGAGADKGKSAKGGKGAPKGGKGKKR